MAFDSIGRVILKNKSYFILQDVVVVYSLNSILSTKELVIPLYLQLAVVRYSVRYAMTANR